MNSLSKMHLIIFFCLILTTGFDCSNTVTHKYELNHGKTNEMVYRKVSKFSDNRNFCSE